VEGAMIERSLADEIYEQAKRLSANDQQLVLELVNRLAPPRGESGASLMERARKINFPKEDLAEIAEALKDFEMINLESWDLPSPFDELDDKRS
jgi:hypothetical protein